MKRGSREGRNPAEGGVIRILYEQHAHIQDLFAGVEKASGAGRQEAFDTLTEFLIAHETAEQAVLRPVSRETAGDDVVQARLQEERKASQVIAELKKLDVNSADFHRDVHGIQASGCRPC